jgi:hypothetical protein
MAHFDASSWHHCRRKKILFSLENDQGTHRARRPGLCRYLVISSKAILAETAVDIKLTGPRIGDQAVNRVRHGRADPRSNRTV